MSNHKQRTFSMWRYTTNRQYRNSQYGHNITPTTSEHHSCHKNKNKIEEAQSCWKQKFLGFDASSKTNKPWYCMSMFLRPQPSRNEILNQKEKCNPHHTKLSPEQKATQSDGQYLASHVVCILYVMDGLFVWVYRGYRSATSEVFTRQRTWPKPGPGFPYFFSVFFLTIQPSQRTHTDLFDGT